MEDSKKKLFSLRSKKMGKESIYEKHLDMIIDLIKTGARTTEIYEIIKNEDPEVANKHHRTAYNLLRQFIASARFQALLDFHIPTTNVISKKITIKSNNIENKSIKKEQNKEEHKRNKESRKEESTPVAKEEGKSAVNKTTDEIVTNKGESSQQDEVQDPVEKVMAGLRKRMKMKKDES